MKNYFAILGLEPSYQLDLMQLEQTYIAVQQQFHPDRMIRKNAQERAEAIQTSMDANEAFEALQSPLTRAEHLLALQNIVVNADNAQSVKPSQALLMEMLELRESMAESTSKADIAKHTQDIKKAMKQTEKRLTQWFEQGAYDDAAQAVIRLRYLGKSLEEAISVHYRLKSHE